MSALVSSSNKDTMKSVTNGSTTDDNNDQQDQKQNENAISSSSLNTSNLDKSSASNHNNPSQTEYSKSPPLVSNYNINPANNILNSESITKKTFDSNLKSFLLQRANENEIVALCLYWFVKVEIKDTKSLPTSTTNNSLSSANNSSSSNNISTLSNNQDQSSNNLSNNNNQTTNLNDSSRSNFQIFMDELLDSLRNGDNYARSIYENITNQERFLKSLNDIIKATNRESGGRDKKVIKLRQFLVDTSKSSSSFDLVNFFGNIPLIIDPGVKAVGINVDKTTMFNSNLMPCKFVFKTVPNLISNESTNDQATFQQPEYATIYKIGDDLRQDQLVLQMIALMDKVIQRKI
jgi:phosphatidylinositol 3-kinase